LQIGIDAGCTFAVDRGVAAGGVATELSRAWSITCRERNGGDYIFTMVREVRERKNE
jgi:hypothetical protein